MFHRGNGGSLDREDQGDSRAQESKEKGWVMSVTRLSKVILVFLGSLALPVDRWNSVKQLTGMCITHVHVFVTKR